MQKIVRGISTFHESAADGVRPLLAHLAVHGQRPQAMMITCSDSRLMPEELTQADPGDLFMLRNIGNLVPDALDSQEGGDSSVGAAIDYALIALHVKDIVVMGHSGCGAMEALLKGEGPTDHVNSWLEHGQPSLKRFHSDPFPPDGLSRVDHLSQANVLSSLENLERYPSVQQRIANGEITLHAWWFDVANAQVHAFRPQDGRFVLLDEAYERPGGDFRWR